MIMPKQSRYIDYDFPKIYQVNKKSPVNIWITHTGLIIPCKDHEEAAKSFVNKNCLLACAEWFRETPYNFKDYRSFVLFKLNWMRATGGVDYDDGFGITVSDSLAANAFNAFVNYTDVVNTAYYMIDTCYEDNTTETSVSFNHNELNKAIKHLRNKTSGVNATSYL